MKTSEKYDFHEARCEICGKYIWMPDPEIWAYKIVNPARHRDWYCCSWHCFRQMPEKPIRGRKSGLKDKIFDLLKQGARPVDIMHATGCTEGTVRYWTDRYQEEDGND